MKTQNSARPWQLPSLRSLFEPNPVFKRELRARWRRPAAYLTLFFYAVPLALGMILFYGDFAANLSSDKSLATIGKELFEALIMVQIAAWLFIAALTAAPVIATERERSLLEALQLANLKASRIVWGKCLSLFSFQALLFLVPLPVVAICFLFGGVDPKTFVLSTITIAITALCGTMIGLYFSSIRPRPGVALRDALIFIVVWTALAALSGTRSQSYQGWPLFIRQPLAVVEVIHPFSGMRFMGNDNFEWPARDLTQDELPSVYSSFQGIRINPTLGAPYTTVDSQTAWLLFFTGLFVLSLLLFLLAVKNTARVLPEAEFVRRAEPKKKRHKTISEAPDKLSARTERALYFGLPILSRHSFDNPVFGRELRGKTRWRAASPLMWMLRAALLFVLWGLYSNWMSAISAANFTWIPQIVMLHLALLCLYAAVSGATMFTRERESNTWESLRLSLLTPGQILHGKIWPLALVLIVFSAPLFAALCLYQLAPSDYGYIRTGSPTIRFTFWDAIRVTGIVAATAFTVGNVAMFISWVSRTTQVALGLSLAINAAWLLLFYGIANSIPAWDWDPDTLRYLSWWNPIAAVEILLRVQILDYYYYSSDAIEKQQQIQQAYGLQSLASLCSVFMLFAASILIIIIAALMRQKFRDEK